MRLRDCWSAIFGPSPRTWGELTRTRRRFPSLRTIPTHVGRTGKGIWAATPMSDHPHARGENTNATQSCTLTSGPSPRTWGEPWPGIPSRPPSRTIPTHVGRTAEIFSQPDRASDHPHARGENMARFGNRSALPGPSPRTWGERRDSRSRWSRNSDHPHARGENPLIMASAAVNCGPSPRTWGEHDPIPIPTSTRRTIPTHVGRTATSALTERAVSDHPHARGENPPKRQGWHPIFGPSPRTWGELP